MTRPLVPKTQNQDAEEEPPQHSRSAVSSTRESVESFVFVFIFFLILGVEAEGFVIPTGSMAPTLMGRHKEVVCPDCGSTYAVNADREVSESASTRPSARYVEAGTCVNCRFQAKIDAEPNFQGDRIYVMKTPIDFPFFSWLGSAVLQRWNVAVFKLPEEPEVRYIKRLVGMPNEILRILRGDIWTRPLNEDVPFQRAIRPLPHQDAMQILVNEDRFRPKSLADDPRWKRWRPTQAEAWSEPQPSHYQFTKTEAANNEWSDLRYHHVFPDPDQWEAIVRGETLPYPPRPTLITDFYSYNTDLTLDNLSNPSSMLKAWSQPHWVGDLTLSFRLGVEKSDGRVRFELVKAGIANRAEIDLSNGLATLFHGEQPLGKSVATPLNQVGEHRIILSNVDDRLTLRVDDLLPFGQGLSYDQAGNPVAPTPADLSPAAIAAKSASITIDELMIKRDIYYTLDPIYADYETLDLEHPLPKTCKELFDWLGNPEMFAAFGQLQPHDYPIRPGSYMMLGDNSPWSRDGRAWSRTDQTDPRRPGQGWDNSGRQSWEVPESLLIGKAFCVYWPHPKPFGPTFKIGRDTKLPIRPAFEKMRFIR